MRAARDRCRQRGAALLLVLWLIVLLTALVGAFALSARIEHIQARVLSHGVVGEQAARAGLEYALMRLGDADPQTRWIADGRVYQWDFNGVPVHLRVVDETGKIDLNVAGRELLAGLMEVLGTDPPEAGRLADAIIDWRDPDDLGQVAGAAEDRQYAAAGLPYAAKNAPFEAVSELQLVLGMPPGLAARMAPHVTVHTGRALPDSSYASSIVLQAAGIDPGPVIAARQVEGAGPDIAMAGAAGTGTYSIESRARLPDGRESVLRAVLRAGGTLPGAAYTTLRWQEGAAAGGDG
ncbi:MAG: general secretion pathway protein GspK [Gammaproteobacteria bacterium]|nr:general secretion pathway protein GspK [Gammaproteobacteria bacterium]